MKTNSVSTYATPFIETMGVTDTTPFDIVAALEENFNMGLFAHVDRRPTTREAIIKAGSLLAVVSEDPVMGFMAEKMAEFRESRRLAEAKWTQRTMLRSNFGRWLEKDEKAIIVQAKEGLETLDDRLACLPYIVEKIRSRKAWKAEQNAANDPSHYSDMSLSYELPPRTKGRSHEPAYYSITGPSGTVIDLEQAFGKHAPILSKNPNEAFRRFIARLNIQMKGGETELLNYLLKAPRIEFTNPQGEVSHDYKFLPSYRSTFENGAWRVIVGWRLNPKCQFGTHHREGPDGYVMPYVENCAGELEPFIPGIHSPSDILTTSQLDYKLLCEDSGLAVTDQNEEVVSYMNEDEELIMQGMVRDDDHSEEEMDSYLLVDAASRMDRMIDLRVGSAVWLLEDFDATLFEITKEVAAECQWVRRGLRKAKSDMQAFVMRCLTEPENPLTADLRKEEGKALRQEVQKLKGELRFLQTRYRADRDSLLAQMAECPDKPVTRKGYLPTPRSTAPDACSLAYGWQDKAKACGFDIKFDPKPTIIPGADQIPLNHIEAPVAREVAEMPPHAVKVFTWSNALSTRLMAERERKNRLASTLEQVSAGTLGIALAFSKAFDEALGLRSSASRG